MVRTEHGKTIAAFTPYKWHSVPHGQYVSNPAGGSFIIALDQREKLILIDTTKVIYNNSSWGPLFGGGCDMQIADECDSNTKSYAGNIQSYNTVDRKYKSNQ